MGNYGDTVRVGDEFRRVVDDTGRHGAAGVAGRVFRLSSGFAVPETRDTALGFTGRTLKTAALTGTLANPAGRNAQGDTKTEAPITSTTGSGDTSTLKVSIVVPDSGAITSITVTTTATGFVPGDTIVFAAVGDGTTAGDYASFSYVF